MKLHKKCIVLLLDNLKLIGFREADEQKLSHIYILRWEIDENEPTQMALLNRIEKAVSRA